MKLKFSFNFDKNSISNINLKPLWAGIIAGIIMSVVVSFMSYFKIMPVKVTNPVSKKANILDSIWPKLQSIPNHFKLNRKLDLIPTSYAANLYDQSKAYVVVDMDNGDILAEKSLSKKLSIASLTKIMTAVVALDLARPEELITISQKSSLQIPTKIGVVPGEKMSLKELLEATLMTSANDAAYALKDGINHKIGADIFITAMNKKAEFLGLKNTHFSNPQGFDSPKNYSSAEDMAILTHYALTNYPVIAEIVKKDYEFLPDSENHKQYDLYNWNGLLGVYPNVLGMKIGNTDGAGTTTVVVSERKGKKILVVVLGTPDILSRDLSAASLLDLGFEKSLNLEPVSITSYDLSQKYSTWQYWN